MGKNNRQRRAKKQAQKKKRQKDKRRNPKKEKTIAPNFYEFQNPFASLTEEERQQVIKEIAKNSAESYEKSLGKIRQILENYDPLILVSTLTSYGLATYATSEGVQKKDSDYKIHQSHIEVLQALILQVDKKELWGDLFRPDVVQELWDALIELLRTHEYKTLADDKEDLPEDKKQIIFIQRLVRGNRKLVRNWGYFSQVVAISRELYSYFDSILAEKISVSATTTIDFFYFLIKKVEARGSKKHVDLSRLAKIKDTKELLIKYHELIGQTENEASEFIEGVKKDKVSARQVFMMLLSHYDLRLPELYTFTLSEIAEELKIDLASAKVMAGLFSMKFGELATFNTDFLYLSNPIWTKPIIFLDEDRFFCVLPQVFFSFVIPSLEGLIEPFAKKQLNDRRSSYLEEKVAEIIQRRFPASDIIPSLRWNYEGQEYETDLVAVIDSHILIVEAKSGKITESALRGAPERLKRHVEDLLVAPNIQSKRLKDRIEALIANPEMEDELRQKIPTDLSKVTRVVRVSVTLEDFAMLQANVKRLQETGWLPIGFEPCPTINIADFDTLFDFIEHPVQILHYLTRRQEIENEFGHMGGFVGDELDMMGLYIDTLLNHSFVEENMSLAITEMSAPLDVYYNSKDAGVETPKPKPKISSLFSAIFNQLEQRKTPQWSEVGIILNRFSPDDQRKLEKKIKQLEKNVRKNWETEGHLNIVFYTPPKTSGYSLCFVMYNNMNESRRYEFIENAAGIGLEPDHVHTCLVIGKNIDDNSLAYNFIGIYK